MIYWRALLLLVIGLHKWQYIMGSSETPNKFLLILLDGFRWDYLKADLPNFKRFRQLGVHAEYMEPTFPSLSFPGYYTILTGLYPESHGFIENTMYDSKNKMFFFTDTTPNGSLSFWWNATDPLWTTATKANRKTYVYMWPGCHVTINDTLPTYYEKYKTINDTTELRKNIAEVLAGFSLNKIDVGIVYSEYTDQIGHEYGPESQNMRLAVNEIDMIIGVLLDGLEKKSLKNKVNIIIVSDHGMTRSDAKSTTRVQVTNAVDLNDIEFLLGYGAEVGVQPVDGKLDKVYSDLKKLSEVFVWKKEEIPENLRFKNNFRVPPIQVVADTGTFILPVLQTSKQVPPFIDRTPMDYNGFHGYIPFTMLDMGAIFLAMGPDFKENIEHGPINMTDVYNLMIHVLQLNGHPNNGTWNNVKDMLKNDGGNILSYSFAAIMIFVPVIYFCTL